MTRRRLSVRFARRSRKTDDKRRRVHFVDGRVVTQQTGAVYRSHVQTQYARNVRRKGAGYVREIPLHKLFSVTFFYLRFKLITQV